MRGLPVVLLCSLTLAISACGDDDGGGSSMRDRDVADSGDDGSVDASDSGLGEDVADDAPDTADDVAPDTPQADLVDELSAPGAFGVGITERTITYTPDGYDDPRSLRTVVWYPTDDTEGTTAQYAGLIPQPGVFVDATIALEQAAPVLVFSHGNGGIAEQSYFLTELLASHGWLVVAFDHTGNTVFDSGDATPFFDLRPQDVSAAIDFIYELPEADQLAGLFGDDLVMAGHSFGGYTTLAVGGATVAYDSLVTGCSLVGQELCDFLAAAEDRLRAGYGDPRIDVLVPMTPAGNLVFGDGLADITAPMLLMSAELDATLPEAQEGDPIWMASDGPDDVRMILDEGGHFTYSNACTFAGATIEGDGCGEGFIPDTEAHPIINAYFRAFVAKHLFDDDQYDDFLAGEGAPDGVTILVR